MGTAMHATHPHLGRSMQQKCCSTSGSTTRSSLVASSFALRNRRNCRTISVAAHIHATSKHTRNFQSPLRYYRGLHNVLRHEKLQSRCKRACRAEHSDSYEGWTCDQLPAASLALAAALLLDCSPALAEDFIKYDPGSGADTVKTIAGAAYALLLIIFAVRLFQKRAKFATGERLASSAMGEIPPEFLRDVPVKRVTPLKALWAAVQAGVFAYLLYLFSSGVDNYFEGQQLPDQYTARNITVTIRTVVSGLSYLLTFLFGANAVGLAAYTVQLIFKPEPDPEAAVLNIPEAMEDASNRSQDGP